MQFFRKLMLLGFLAGALVLTGCKEEATLHSQLEERQANLVMAALMGAGIDCRKEAGEENMWNVIIDTKDFATAVNLLESQGLPQRNYQGISEVFKKTGMVSSPSEERIRFMDALSQGLERTIASIDGILDAHVHIVLPENDPFAKNMLPSSAAVAIRSRWDAEVEDLIPQVKSLVMNAIEGLQYEKITVIVFKAAPPQK
jgi:type III secretion protein J